MVRASPLLLIVVLLACGGLGSPDSGVPSCPVLDAGDAATVDGRVCVGVPEQGTASVGRPGVAVHDATGAVVATLDLASEVEVVEVLEPVQHDGVVARQVRVEADGVAGVVDGAALTAWAGDAWWERRAVDLPFGVVLGARGPVLSVGEHTLALGLPAAGRLEVDVDRWGDLEPLFRISMCGVTDCPWRAVTMVDGEPTVISDPEAWRKEPERLAEEPDCDAARPLELTPAGGSVVDIRVPAWVDEPEGPAVCRATGDAGTDGILTVCTLGARRAGFLVIGDTWTHLPCGSDPLLDLVEPVQFAGKQVRERGDVRF